MRILESTLERYVLFTDFSVKMIFFEQFVSLCKQIHIFHIYIPYSLPFLIGGLNTTMRPLPDSVRVAKKLSPRSPPLKLPHFSFT